MLRTKLLAVFDGLKRQTWQTIEHYHYHYQEIIEEKNH